MIKQSFETTYSLGRFLGKGAFSSVYECQDKMTGNIRAVKVISHEKTQKFNPCHEVEVLRKLTHRLIPKVIEVFTPDCDGNYYIVMERCNGLSLRNSIAKYGQFPEATAVNIIRQLFTVLHHIHTQGYAHLDLKPDNIIFNPANSEIRVVDFGFATNKTDKCTAFNCSLPYASPELLKQQPYDAKKADIWAAGIIYYEMTTGRLPWSIESLYSIEDLFKEIITKKLSFAEIKSKNAILVIKRALERDIESRSSASDVLDIINRHGPPKCMRIMKQGGSVRASIIKPNLRGIKI